MRNKRGSFSIEYALLISVIIVSLIAMSIYFIKALSGRWRQVGDGFGQGRQYEPGNTTITSP
jgi:Flp pilus assembly pilin Flp